MSEKCRRQIEGLARKQKKIIQSAKTRLEKKEAIVLWAAFLSGLRLAGAITGEEYKILYSEVEEFKDIA